MGCCILICVRVHVYVCVRACVVWDYTLPTTYMYSCDCGHRHWIQRKCSCFELFWARHGQIWTNLRRRLAKRSTNASAQRAVSCCCAQQDREHMYLFSFTHTCCILVCTTRYAICITRYRTYAFSLLYAYVLYLFVHNKVYYLHHKTQNVRIFSASCIRAVSCLHNKICCLHNTIQNVCIFSASRKGKRRSRVARCVCVCDISYDKSSLSSL